MSLLTFSPIQLSHKPFINIKLRLIAATGLLLVGSFATAAPSVSDNTISWPDDGWYQVQDQATHTEVCGGGRSCDVEPGTYVVINHSTGERFNDIIVVGHDGHTNGVTVTGNTISWPDDGWYQVQDQVTHTEVCGGGRFCDVEPGTYVVINHSTGERFNDITVVGDDDHTYGVTVTGNTISWPDDGWYQVQEQVTHTEVCGGGRSCDVEPGIYVVINHSTGERFNDITVVGDGGPVTTPEPVQASIKLVADKTFRISWQLSTAAQFYRVFENPDGISGFADISGELDSRTTDFDHRVALFARVNAQYLVQSCNTHGCVDSEEVVVSGTLEEAVGYFKASTPDSHGQFGSTLSMSADANTLAVAGSTYSDDPEGLYDYDESYDGSLHTAAVYVFGRNEAGWEQQAVLQGSITDASDRFGTGVSLSADGQTLVVGAAGEDSAATGINGDQNDNSVDQAGAAYVFERRNGSWQQQAYLKGDVAVVGDWFGNNVAISEDGNTIAVTSSTASQSEDDSDAQVNTRLRGGVYVFVRTNEEWSRQAYLKTIQSHDVGANGRNVQLSANGDVMSVGTQGIVGFYTRSNETWDLRDFLSSQELGANASFARLGYGPSVALSSDGNTVVVGARSDSSAAAGIDGNPHDEASYVNSESGAAYIFHFSDGSWQQQAYLKASNAGGFDHFGTSVAISSDGLTVAIGAPDENSNATGINGDQNDNTTRSGAVYVFEFSGGSWIQSAFVKASNTRASDARRVGSASFGNALKLSADGDSLAVAARQESSNATGINGDQDDATAAESGAVYLY